jgi:transcriptional regulator with XRE-family HTH domain
VSVNERIVKIYESLQINQAEFARRISVSSQTLNNQVKGKNGLSITTLELIAKSYPDLNIRWLVSGEGNMWDNKGILIKEVLTKEHTEGGIIERIDRRLTELEQELKAIKKKLENK